MVIVWILLSSVPLGLSLWALLDAARRPAWAWAFASRSQVAWLGAVAFGVLALPIGLAVSTWYLMRVRPQIQAIEAGDLGDL